ncbi:hypothetical protein FPZ12_003155 [Amycolatopsis acidicola]|uniref:DUF4386 domain-containing protein n=1 Tax=Amycolatopsis acidicola TaxID=2596893 RepID=A0A5N0VHW4_9PSEU|nr:hypothetical protein [Amycolatopsis acidicola]KAA9165967.1 hypothetical protein FPZ12_003155 [Amycolatopsis acidicola]
MNERVKLLCAWCGPATVVLALIGWLIAGVLPIPPAAHQSAADIAAFYEDSPSRTMAGLILSALAVGLVFPLVALIGVHMVRMEGRTPLMTFLQLVTGAATGVLLLIPLLLMVVCAFRPDRSPELTLLLNDVAWLLFITPIAPFMIQNVAIGIAVLADRNPEPVLPRWVGYLNFWVAFLFVPDVLAYFFYSGPFAWQGIFVFWLALTAYAVWLVTMGLVLRRSVKTSAAVPVAA